LSKTKTVIPQEVIENKILLIRSKKVMLDKDLAVLYGVQTRTLNQAVKRNVQRFPEDFMFQLTREEAEKLLRSQFVTLKRGRHYKYLPYAFTENGVAMLSSILNSEGAIEVNIQIMRTFTRLREMLLSHKDLQRKIEEMEKKYDYQFKVVFDAIKQLLEPSEKPKKRIGFLTG
jgi:hypothetical protein